MTAAKQPPYAVAWNDFVKRNPRFARIPITDPVLYNRLKDAFMHGFSAGQQALLAEQKKGKR